jgi:hypothetical protein
VSLRNLIIKLHIYAGLLTFGQLAIYGIAGIVATFQPGLERPKIARAVQYVPFDVPASATDRQVADRVYETLHLPLSRPMPSWFLRRTPENDLLLDFYNINGIWRVVVLERQHQLRVEQIHNSTWLFLGDVHAAAGGDPDAPRLIRVWSVYNAFAMWCLLAFCVSGVYLWLSADARSPWAWISFGSGTAILAALWIAFR